MNNAEEITKSHSALGDNIMRREIIGFHKYFLYYAIIYSKMVLGELHSFLFFTRIYSLKTIYSCSC